MKLYISNKIDKDVEEYIEKNNIHAITCEDYINKIIKNNIYNLSSFTEIIIDINSLLDTQEEIINTIIAIKKMYNSNLIIVVQDVDKQDIIIKSLLKSNITRFLIYSDNYLKDLDNMLYNNKNVVNENRCIRIAIAGTQNHIGTTTQCMNLASFLKSYGYKVCYIQKKNSKDINLICNNDSDEFLKNEITFFTEEKFVVDINMYDYCIYDYSVLNSNNSGDFINCDIKILITGSRIYELKELENSIKYLENIQNINLIVNFCNKDSNIKKSIQKIVKKGNKIHFSNYINEIFDFSNNKNIYFDVMKSYLIYTKEKKNISNKNNLKNFKLLNNLKKLKIGNKKKNTNGYIKKIFKIVLNIIYCTLISLGITVILNSSTRQMLIDIIKGGI